jgi:hypothetical protein
MNFLVASMFVDGTDLGDVAAGAYDWLVFDEPNGVLGLNIPSVSAGPSVVDRQVLYGNGVIAPDKQALLPGQTATFANYTSSTGGITGVVLDVSGLANPDGLGPEDFVVRTGATGDLSTWKAGPAPAVSVGVGPGDTDRVTLTWAEGAMKNKWVQITVGANADTGLAAPDVFYFGNLAGDTGDHPAGATQAVVNGTDYAATRAHMYEAAAPDSRFDHRRDGRINTMDIATVRANQFQTLRPGRRPAAAPGMMKHRTFSVAPLRHERVRRRIDGTTHVAGRYARLRRRHFPKGLRPRRGHRGGVGHRPAQR